MSWSRPILVLSDVPVSRNSNETGQNYTKIWSYYVYDIVYESKF